MYRQCLCISKYFIIFAQLKNATQHEYIEIVPLEHTLERKGSREKIGKKTTFTYACKCCYPAWVHLLRCNLE